MLMGGFEAWFSGLPDPRAPNVRHDLIEVVFIALAAVLCGAEDCTDMADFAHARQDWLGTILDLPHGVPSHDTFSRVFRLLEPAPFEAAFTRFATGFRGKLKGLVAIDGKALRGAYKRGARSSPLHMVNIWADEARMAIVSKLAPNRNEIAGALEALALISLEGCIVTADALYCRADIASAITGRGGDYVLAVKANQPSILAFVAERLASSRAAASASAKPVPAHDRPAHDRTEMRTARTVAIKGLADISGIPRACAAGVIISLRRMAGGREETATRYFLLSRPMSPKRLLGAVRAHWGIENQLHWTLDVVFKEDASRTRTGNAPANLSLIRKLALGIVRSAPVKGSIKTRIKRAAWNNDALNLLLAHMR
jgi:predicted transposase YbfD/YdcC